MTITSSEKQEQMDQVKKKPIFTINGEEIGNINGGQEVNNNMKSRKFTVANGAPTKDPAIKANLEKNGNGAADIMNNKTVSNGNFKGMGCKKPTIPEIVGEDEDPDSFEAVDAGGDILPWNILEDPPFGTQKELYPIEGSWRLIANQNFDKYLAAVGVTPLMAQMVLRSDYMITIYEDIDHCWKILTETSIKAKSIKGYRCRNYKMTANKFMLEEEKPELLEDWDPRLVVTTVTFEDEKALILDQAAEKDQKFSRSSKVTFTSDQEDVLTITCETDDGVKAVRKLVRHNKNGTGDKGMGSRKHSAPF